MEDRRQSAYWDRVAQEKTFSHPLDAARLARYLAPRSRVLDLGCGYGRASVELARLGHDVVGIDPSAGMIERGRGQFPHLDLRVWEETQLPFDDARFEACALITVLTSTPDDDEQRALIAEATRVLVPGGLLLVSDLFLQDDPRNRERYAEGRERFGRLGVFALGDEGVIVRHHEREWIQSLLSPLTQLELVEFDVLSMNRNRCRAFQYWGRTP